MNAGIEEKTADPRQASVDSHSQQASRTHDAASGDSKHGAGDKLGKRAKRMEKEAKEERLQKAQALQARIESENQRLAQQQQKVNAATGGGGPAVSSSEGVSAVSSTTTTVQRCTTCGGMFTDAIQYRQHFRYDMKYFYGLLLLIVTKFCTLYESGVSGTALI